MKYSRGVFLNITSSAPRSWETDWQRIRDAVQPEHVEVWLEYLPTPTEVSLLSSLLNGTPILVHGPFIGMSFATPWEELADLSMARGERAAQISSDLKATVITFHSGTYPAFEEHDRALDRLAERVDTLLRRAGGPPLIAFENMPRAHGTALHALTTTTDLLSLGRRVPAVNYTLDVGHCIQNGDEYDKLLEGRHPVANIHLHDGCRHGRAHRALKTGELDLPQFISLLQRTDYSSYVGLETLGFDDTKRSWDAMLEEERDRRS